MPLQVPAGPITAIAKLFVAGHCLCQSSPGMSMQSHCFAMRILAMPLRCVSSPSPSAPCHCVARRCTSLRVFAIAARVIAEPSPCIRSHTSQSHAFAFLGPSTRCHCGAIRFNAIAVLCVSSLVVAIQCPGLACRCVSFAYRLLSLLSLCYSPPCSALPLLCPSYPCFAPAVQSRPLLCRCQSKLIHAFAHLRVA